jgi:adenylate cyclase
MASQLAGSAGEPLLADDTLSLEVMLSRLTDQPSVLGAAILGRERTPMALGVQPPDWFVQSSSPYNAGWQWRDSMGETRAVRSFRSPIRFSDLDVGIAVVTLDAGTYGQRLNSALIGLAVTILILLPGAVGLGVFMVRRLSKPLQALASLSDDMEDGEIAPFSGGAGQGEIDRVVSMFNHLSAQVQEKQRLENLFRCYVPTPLSDRLLQEPSQQPLQGKTFEGSVLFCDVTGFTALSETLPPEQVVDLLNEYFGYISIAAHSCRGVVDSFSGDCAVLVFGRGDPDALHAIHAATCAMLIRDTVRRINLRRAARAEFPVWFRIAVNSGPMAQCNLGGSERMQHTVIGDTVNVASRLCEISDPGHIILGEATALAPEVAERLLLSRLPRQPLHGRRGQVVPFQAEALAPKQQTQLRRTLDRLLPIEEP